LKRDIFMNALRAHKGFLDPSCSEFVTTMTLKSALQDVKETTLAAVSGLLARLAYLASLRRDQQGYQHWGISLVHGPESCERALRSAHSEVLTEVLRTPLPELAEDLRESSQDTGVIAAVYVEELRKQFDDLVPSGQANSPSATHLNSVLVALSCLEKNPGRATRSTS
jgi:hypothetical protein